MEARQSPRIIKPPRTKSDLKAWMDELLREFNQTSYLETDPIGLVYDYHTKEDRELVSLIAALFSFGNVKSIRANLHEYLKPLGPHPYKTLVNLNDTEIKTYWKDSYYRFYTAKDIQHLFKRLRDLLQANENIQSFYAASYSGDPTSGLIALREFFLDSHETPGSTFMFSDPLKSPSKRWHMWLRWLVRNDEIDLGLWSVLTPAQLTLPLDVHVFDMVQHLGLTKSKTPSRKAALEVTDRLREWDPSDPVKYDFALCRLGILGYKRALIG